MRKTVLNTAFALAGLGVGLGMEPGMGPGFPGVGLTAPAAAQDSPKPPAGSAPPAGSPSSEVPQVPNLPGKVELTFWSTIRNSTNPAVFKGYLEAFPKGVFADLARLRIKELEADAKRKAEGKDAKPKVAATPPKTAQPSAPPAPEPPKTAQPSEPPAPEPPKTAQPSAPPAPEPPKTAQPSAPPAPEPPKTAQPSAPPAPEPPKTAQPSAPPAPEPPKTAQPSAPPAPEPPKTAQPSEPPAPEPPKVAQPSQPPAPEQPNGPSALPPPPEPEKPRTASPSEPPAPEPPKTAQPSAPPPEPEKPRTASPGPAPSDNLPPAESLPPLPQVAGGNAPMDITNREFVQALQRKLYELNYKIARTDGQYDKATLEAIKAWQRNVKLPPTGEMTQSQWKRMQSATVPDTWGAIAYTARGIRSLSWRRPSRRNAENAVMAACQRRAGRNARCSVMAAAGSACIALATYRQRFGSTTYFGAHVSRASTLDEAMENAISRCERAPRSRGRCRIRTYLCADASHRGRR